MNTDDKDHVLLETYRRASDEADDRPGEFVRRSIIAQARTAAERQGRTSAANDARYWMGAAAGIGVLGIAVLLWRQTQPQLSADFTTAKSVPATESVTANPAPAAATPEPEPARATGADRGCKASSKGAGRRGSARGVRRRRPS
jgi:hypothetical protein